MITSNNFSFSTYKNTKWDIEHVHAQASETISDKNDQIDWMKKVNSALFKIENDDFPQYKNEILVEIHLLLLENDSLNNDEFNIKFQNLYQKVIMYFENLNNGSEINPLSNLVLLDAGTNRSYKNAIFSSKRNVIVEKDKKGEFIPVCTKNVFLKYYTQDATQMYLWSKNDQEQYFKDIKNTLTEFENNVKKNIHE